METAVGVDAVPALNDVKIAETQRIFTEKIQEYSVIGIAHTIAEAKETLPVLEPDSVLLGIFFLTVTE